MKIQIKSRLLATVQSKGNLGKSTECLARIEWLKNLSVEWQAYDLDDAHRSVLKRYPERTKLIPVSGPESAEQLLRVFRNAGKTPVQIVDARAQATRDVNGRANRVGSTLWKLCDFHPTVSEAERANIEAALEASGLLDAWVTPDGQMLDKDDHETVLAIGISEPAPKGWGLDVALIPSVHRQGAGDTAISGETVSAVLSQIGFGAGIGKVWVNSEGSWQNGPLRGKWNKPAAEHIGHSSRETARLCRIARLTVEIDTAKELARVIEQELQVLAERSAQLNREIGESPSDGNVRQSLAQVESSRRAVNQFRLQLTEAELQATAARRSMVEAADQRDQTAADLGIRGWVDKISALIDATHNYRLTLAELWPAIRAQTEAQAQLAAVIEGVAEATQHRDQRNARHQQAKELAAAAAERFQTIENAVGSTVRDIQQKLENAIQRVADIRKKKEDASQKKSEQREQSAVANAKISEITNDLTTKELERGGAIRGLVAFVATRQLTVAHSDFMTIETGEWSVARSVEIARLIESVLEIVDHSDEAWARNQRDIHHHFETLQTSLRAHGYMPEATMVDTIFVVSVQFQNRACTIAELHDHVVAMIQERQELLDARERQVLENYLIDEVAEHLHDLLHRALEWKQQINAELSERPMSTGMMLRFSWEPRPDLPTSFAEARRLLLGARGTWSPNQRAAVGEFLQQQIKAAQSANDTGTWQDHLSQAFDYRKWHQFGVERKQDGDWKHLTRRTHGTGSGGEKAIALTLPQLAAAAAHYRSADKNAPRLILLDEAFVGVDKNMRAKCMDLLRVFDLDVVMTSESEWGCYQTVPGIAIYQLSAREGIDAVYATRWVWNGKQRVRDHTPLPPARPPIADDELRQPVEIT